MSQRKRAVLDSVPAAALRQIRRGAAKGLEFPPEDEPGKGGDQDGGIHLLARAVADGVRGLVHGLLAGLGERRRGGIQGIFRTGRRFRAALPEGNPKQHNGGYCRKGTENPKCWKNAKLQLEPQVEGAQGDRDGDDREKAAGQRQHGHRDDAAYLALEIDADKSQQGREHQLRPRIRPMISPRHSAPATTASGFLRATFSNSLMRVLASSSISPAISAPISLAAPATSPPTDLASLATVSRRLATSSESLRRSSDISPRAEAADCEISSLARCMVAPMRLAVASASS